MTKHFFILLFFCLFLTHTETAFCQETDFTERIKKLETAFSEKDYHTFFENFPNTFAELEAIYGYSEEAMPLYYVAKEHIDYLFDSRKNIDVHMFAKKICNVGINGKWNADAVSYFQDHISVLLHLSPITEYAVEILNSKTDKEIESFWRFMFDGPVPRKEYFAELYPAFHKTDKKQACIIKKEFRKTQKSYKNEH